jgi:hypothetical protein
MTLTRKQTHLKRLLQEYMQVSICSNWEELSEITLDTIDESSDFNTSRINILSKLMEEASLYYSEELKDFIANRDKLNPMMQELIDNTYCKDWF